MTRDPKSNSKTGATGTDAGKTHAPKTSVAKTALTKTPVAKIPVAKIPVTNTSATKGPPATRKTSAVKSGAAKSPKSGDSKSGGAKSNGHGAGRQPGSAPRKANKRGAARLAAVQALYQMDMTGAGLNEILAQFESHWLGREVEGEQYLPAEAAFFRDIVSGVVDEQRDLDPRIDAALEATWPLKRIEVILRSVLRAGAYELSRRTDIPARVVVSEYVDVARAFVDKTETGMVNAVLDRMARNVRAEEFG